MVHVNICFYLGVAVFMCGLLSFTLNWGHLVVSLLAMEVMVLSLYYLFGSVAELSGSGFSGLFYISLAVCEGCLGLSVFVNMVCVEGSDKMSLLSHLEW